MLYERYTILLGMLRTCRAGSQKVHGKVCLVSVRSSTSAQRCRLLSVVRVELVVRQVFSCGEPLLDKREAVPRPGQLNVAARHRAALTGELHGQRSRFTGAFRQLEAS